MPLLGGGGKRGSIWGDPEEITVGWVGKWRGRGSRGPVALVRDRDKQGAPLPGPLIPQPPPNPM